MAFMHCRNLSVYLNSVTERGLITPPHPRQWSVDTFHVVFLTVEGILVERDWKQPPSCQHSAAQTLGMPSQMVLRLSHERGGLP